MTKLKQYFSIAVVAAALLLPGLASAKTLIRVQSVIPTSADEVVMLNRFGDNVRALTGGEV